MPQQQTVKAKPKDPVPDVLASAKATLAHANQTFPSPKALASPAPKAAPATAPAPAKAPTLGDELAAKKTMMDKAVKALPQMHRGGPVPRDGAYQLKAGEHVLTAREADRARTHALAHAGMRSMAVMPKKNLPTQDSVTLNQTVPNTQFKKVDESPASTAAAKGDKHVATAKHVTTAPAPKVTARTGKTSPITPNARTSKHNLATTSTAPKATDAASKKRTSLATGMSKLAAARGSAAKPVKIRPETNQGAKIVDKTKKN